MNDTVNLSAPVCGDDPCRCDPPHVSLAEDRAVNPQDYVFTVTGGGSALRCDWTLHVQADDTDALAAMVEKVQHLAGAGVDGRAIVGSHIGGDSFDEWCEPYEPERGHTKGLALHVDIVSRGRATGVRRARLVAEMLGVTTATRAVLSSSRDWSKQVEVF